MDPEEMSSLLALRLPSFTGGQDFDNTMGLSTLRKKGSNANYRKWRQTLAFLLIHSSSASPTGVRTRAARTYKCNKLTPSISISTSYTIEITPLRTNITTTPYLIWHLVNHPEQRSLKRDASSALSIFLSAMEIIAL
jgi:hypothetical protein